MPASDPPTAPVPGPLPRRPIGVFALPMLLAMLVGCVTPYAPISASKKTGYDSEPAGTNEFLVTFLGNGNTSPERVRDFALLRAAELVSQAGAQYFAVPDIENLGSAQSYTSPPHYYRAPGLNDPYGRGMPLASDSFGPNSESTWLLRTEPEKREYYRPGVRLRVQILDPPVSTAKTYEAAPLITELRRKYRIRS